MRSITHSILILLGFWSALTPSLPARVAQAKEDDTHHTVPMPGPSVFFGGGQLMSLMAIGPVDGSRVIGATFHITWASDGLTPASDLLVEVEVPTETGTASVTVTGADLGFGSGVGVFRGAFWTDELNGVIDHPGAFQNSVVMVTIGSVSGPVQGRGFFVRSGLVLDMIPAGATTVEETFEPGQNEAGWTWNFAGESISATGGNPDSFLMAPGLFTFGPDASTGPGVTSDWTGDYASRGVVALGADLKTLNVTRWVPYKLTLILSSENGTPTNYDDDWGYYIIGPKEIPKVVAAPNAAGWESYDFLVPSQESRLPKGWTAFGTTGPGKSWADLMRSVDRVDFFYGDPGVPQLTLNWSVGLDNPRIATR